MSPPKHSQSSFATHAFQSGDIVFAMYSIPISRSTSSQCSHFSHQCRAMLAQCELNLNVLAVAQHKPHVAE